MIFVKYDKTIHLFIVLSIFILWVYIFYSYIFYDLFEIQYDTGFYLDYWSWSNIKTAWLTVCLWIVHIFFFFVGSDS